ncbi:hypothetical protein [Desulfurispira natronophila]|uniref:Lipopolysaccharide biosynthesis regulator YciM n=1 Tax=Desulfurispira natronophila TaxID=682562 RepID=A0A7W7Y616_9BACT|nr:hypothetical protein [Desulfurispira natronophila]MBB5022765.1 lipopolysaccharide biosynthesis regulator YciM [Desulfurispira natronophila]
MLIKLKNRHAAEPHRHDYVFEGIQKALRLDSEDKYAYLALGQLLRERGELEQAIKIHKTLQVGAQQDIFLHALLELTKDYKAAGLLDRAKDSLNEYLQLKDSVEGYALMLEVSILLREYEAVVQAYRKLGKLTGENYQYEISLFYYLLYEQTQDKGHLTLAYKQYNKNFFANLAYARDLRGRPEKGINYLDTALEAPHAVGSMVYPLLEGAYYEYLGKKGIRERFQRRIATFGFEISTVQHYSHFLYSSGYKQDAFDLLEEVIERGTHSVHIYRMLAMLHQQEGNSEDAARIFIQRYPQEGESFRCSQCGFVSRHYELLCSSCKSIGAMDEQFAHFDMLSISHTAPEVPFGKIFPLHRDQQQPSNDN